MSTVFSFDVLLKWARRNDAVCIFESTKIPEIGGRGRRVTRKFQNHFVSWGTVCPLENVNLFGVLDPVEQPAKFKKFESKQTAMNSSLHEELRALASNLLR